MNASSNTPDPRKKTPWGLILGGCAILLLLSCCFLTIAGAAVERVFNWPFDLRQSVAGASTFDPSSPTADPVGSGSQGVATPDGHPMPPAPTLEPVAPVTGPANAGPASLNYDETNNDPLAAGQSNLIAIYLRMPGPITQAQLEDAVAQIQQEAASTNAEVHEGQTLTLDQHKAWFVWCSDASQIDPPADVAHPLEPTLMASDATGRVFVQIPFAEGVPLRNDDTWTGCEAGFWAVAVH